MVQSYGTWLQWLCDVIKYYAMASTTCDQSMNSILVEVITKAALLGYNNANGGPLVRVGVQAYTGGHSMKYNTVCRFYLVKKSNQSWKNVMSTMS